MVFEYSLTDAWKVRSQHDLFGHTVTVHQNGSAVVLDVDGLSIVGDYIEIAGKSFIAIPRHMAICPTPDDAKKAVEIAYNRHKEAHP